MGDQLALASGRWFQPDNADPDAVVRLFLFPYAGGNAPMYREWLPYFPAGVAVQALQLPGRLDRRNEPLLGDVPGMVDEVCEALSAELDDRPYALFGHSLGALLAYRVAVAMERESGTGPILLAAAGWTPEGFRMPTVAQVQLPQDELVEWIVSLGSLPAAIYEDAEMLALTIPPTRADLTACARYVDDRASLSCPVVTYSGRDDPLLAPDAARSWMRRTPDYLGNQEFPGGHFFIYDAVLPIAADLTRQVLRLARRAAGPAGPDRSTRDKEARGG